MRPEAAGLSADLPSAGSPARRRRRRPPTPPPGCATPSGRSPTASGTRCSSSTCRASATVRWRRNSASRPAPSRPGCTRHGRRWRPCFPPSGSGTPHKEDTVTEDTVTEGTGPAEWAEVRVTEIRRSQDEDPSRASTSWSSPRPAATGRCPSGSGPPRRRCSRWRLSPSRRRARTPTSWRPAWSRRPLAGHRSADHPAQRRHLLRLRGRAGPGRPAGGRRAAERRGQPGRGMRRAHLAEQRAVRRLCPGLAVALPAATAQIVAETRERMSAERRELAAWPRRDRARLPAEPPDDPAGGGPPASGARDRVRQGAGDAGTSCRGARGRRYPVR